MTSLQDAGVATRPRELWVDVLRVLVIAGVVVVHTATGYIIDLAGWYYDDERTTAGIWSTLATVPAFFGAVFALGPLFLIAGWYSAQSIAQRGPTGFARSRLVRLGVPLLVFVLLVQPLTNYLGNRWDESRSFAHYLGTTEVSVMWFAAALLVFSLVYAAWERLRPGAASPASLGPGVLVIAVLTVALTSFAVWLVWPLNEDVYLNLRWPAWPQGAVLFALGVHARHGGWLEHLPGGLQRHLGWMAIAGMFGLMTLLAVEVAPEDGEELVTRGDWPTLFFAFLYGVVAVTFTLWFVGWVQRRRLTHSRLLDKMGRASYATYFVHPLVLTVVMLLFASVPVAPEIKFVLVAAAGIPACFLVGYALTRLPGISRVL